MIYTVTLNPALDYTLNAKFLRHDDINRSENESITYGGKGINVSVVLSRLGVENTALGFTGGFTGRQLEKMMKDDSLSCDFTHLENGVTRINVKIRSEEELDINASGPVIASTDIEKLLEKLEKAVRGDIVVLAGSIPSGMPENIYCDIIKRLNEKCAKTVVDVSGKALVSVAECRPFLIKPNHHELGDIFGERADSREKIVELASVLRQMGAENVLVSRAEKGAVLLASDGKIYESKNAPGKLVDSTGCGDSMVAGFIAGMIETNDFAYALKLGTACGNAAAYRKGLPEKDEIETLLRLL